MCGSLPAESAVIHPAFQRDRFLLRSAVLAASETHRISDGEGTPLLEAASEPRITRLVSAVVVSLAVFCIVLIVLIMILVAALNLVDVIAESFPLFLSALIVNSLLAALVSIMVFFRVLGRSRFALCAEEARNRPLVELRPKNRFGLSTVYDVCDQRGAVLATLRTNHVRNLFRERWVGFRPTGRAWFVAREDSIIPRVLRVGVRGVGSLVLLAAVLVVLVTVAMNLPASLWQLPGFLLLLSLVVFVVAFLLRKLVPDFLILQADQGATLGGFRRELDARAPNLLDMSLDCDYQLDRRVAVAVAVLLDRRG